LSREEAYRLIKQILENLALKKAEHMALEQALNILYQLPKKVEE
jgi:hypothetical protein